MLQVRQVPERLGRGDDDRRVQGQLERDVEMRPLSSVTAICVVRRSLEMT
jgi:hypothetical protein